MKIIVKPHRIIINNDKLVNEREVNVSRCYFEFDKEITDDFVKEAYFTFKGNTYKQLIQNNECSFPQEVLTDKGQIEIGVVAYKIDDEMIRYNPRPAYFNTLLGSLKDDVENSEEITPTDKEQILSELANKQNTLVSGVNIKTINNETLLGEGNINITGGSGGTSDYEDLNNKPSINNVELSGNKSLNDLGIQPAGSYALASDIPTNLSQLTDDTTHRLVTDTEKTTWNNKSDFSGSYNDLTDKPTLFSGDYDDLTNKPSIPTKISDLTDDSNFLESADLKTINGETIVGSGDITISGGTDIYIMQSLSTTRNEIDLLGLKKGVYIIEPSSKGTMLYLYYSPYRNGTNTWQVNILNNIFYVLTDITDNMPNNTPVIVYSSLNEGILRNSEMIIKTDGYAGLDVSSYTSDQIFTLNTYQTVSSRKTFTALPESSVTPTTNNQFTNKKYVDDAIASAITTTLGGSY